MSDTIMEGQRRCTTFSIDNIHKAYLRWKTEDKDILKPEWKKDNVNFENKSTDLYLPRKCDYTDKLITPKDNTWV